MASLLRQIVAGPRARHPEAGLDLCYVTENIIATSGPSGTYPQRAYRNPLDELVKWLDGSHGEDWAIWEFRAEGTGYPDSEVYNRIYHYPFPDHHPPPFALIPHIMASMRNWLKEKEGRVVVVHCKAGKGRSGTASCSYLISEEGWSVEKALNRFTERRMRPNMGKGVSIPSQLRWIDYVDRWAKHGKIYVERKVEIVEVHCWGLKDGVKIQIEGFVNEGKVIKTFHTFTRKERQIVRGEIEKSGGLASVMSEVMGNGGIGRSLSRKGRKTAPRPTQNQNQGTSEKTADRGAEASPVDGGSDLDGAQSSKEDLEDLGKGDVVFRPATPVILPTSDINIDIERRNKTAFDLTYVTAVAHVWFNAFFEGRGPEQKGIPDGSGVFEITWEAMDGIKGSSRKGIAAFDKIAIVWKAHEDEGGRPGVVITEPGQGEEVQQAEPADWKGEKNVAPSEDKDLGLRTSSPIDSTADVSKASSLHSLKGAKEGVKEGKKAILTAPDPQEHSTAGVRSHGRDGEQLEAADGPDVATGGSGPGEPTTRSPTSSSLAHAPSDGTAQEAKGRENGGGPGEELKSPKEHMLGHMGKMNSDYA